METTIFIVSFCSILLLGLGHIIYDVCIISHRVSDIKTFLNVLNAFIIKYGHVDILHGDFVLKIEGWTFCMVEPAFSAHGR